MAFSKEHQTELKHIEKSLSQLELLSAKAGFNLDTWNPEMQFEDFSARKLEVIQNQSDQRQAAFKSAGKGAKRSNGTDKITAGQ